MTEMNQGRNEAIKDLADQARVAIESLTNHAGLVGALFIATGAVASLALALNKFGKLTLWLIPVVLYFAGALLLAKPLKDRGTTSGEMKEMSTA